MKSKLDFFGDGMRVFLSYISRKLVSNPLYKPHPLVRALEIALQEAEKIKPGERVMGVSQEGDATVSFQPYAVVVEKMEDEMIQVISIENLMVGKSVPPDIMVMIFRLQIQLDKIEGEFVNSGQATEALNKVFPDAPFFALGDRWKEARDRFIDQMKKKEISLATDPKIVSSMEAISENTPWEEYPQLLRSVIGSTFGFELGAKVTITSPTDAKIEKHKIFDLAIEFSLGQSAQYIQFGGNS